jgi:hypothetical protein
MIVGSFVFVLSYSAYLQFLEPYGLGAWTKFLSAGGSLAVTAVLIHFEKYILEVAAYLPRAERAKLNPMILLMSLFILLVSTYPHVQKMGGGFAARLEDEAYIAQVVDAGKNLQAEVRSYDQVGGLTRAAKSETRDFEEREKRGLLSGIDSSNGRPGPVSDWIGGFATSFENFERDIAAAQETASAIGKRMGQAAENMSKASQDNTLSAAQRRVAMQTAADDYRTAMNELAQVLPGSAILAFARGLQGEISEPAVGAAPHVRDGQQRAIEQVKRLLKKHGKAIEEAVAPIARPSIGEVPVYNPPPIPILVIKHARQLVNIIGVALGIDLLVIGLYFFTARLNDAIRRRPEEAVRALTVEEILLAEQGKAMILSAQLRRDWSSSSRLDGLDSGYDGGRR